MQENTIRGYYKPHPKESLYFIIRLTFSLLIYTGAILIYSQINDGIFSGLLVMLPLFLLIFGVIFFIKLIQNGLMVGLIQSMSVKLNDRQLPEIYQIVKRFSQQLGIKRTPNVYLLQSGGALNAFSKKFFQSSYVVVYSDLLEAYYDGDTDAIEFVIAHELGHIKRHHFWKEVLLFPSLFIPFLPLAYYRACEYTCDNIGKFFNPNGAVNGLLMLAGGKKLYKNLNLKEYLRQGYSDDNLWRWLAEKFLTHPALYRRLKNIYIQEQSSQIEVNQTTKETPPITEEKTEIPSINNENDHSRYMPG